MSASKPESRVWLVFRTFAALPCFLIVTVIFWELALGAGLLGSWAAGHGWSLVGWCIRGIGIVIGLVTILATIVVFVAWVVQMARVIRGQT